VADVERINHPPHYGGDTVYEAIKVIEAWKLNFNLGNAAKYICRAGQKPGAQTLEDLQKAAWYLNREIEKLKGAATMRINVLDHGYVELVEAWGCGKGGIRTPDDCHADSDYERGIVEAARQSTQGTFRGWDEDKKLLKRLYDNNHATPFEFAGMVIEVQAPILVFREWHRHRTQSYNEMSARYAPLPDLCYKPEWGDIVARGEAATKNKQAAGVVPFNSAAADDWHSQVGGFYERAEELYQGGLAAGVPKELARITMPVGHYSRMRASTNLRNWLAFLTLRMDPLAQWEIRQFAYAVGECVAQVFPQTWALFQAGQR
jgi:thymidylate synthase (FAD)